MSTQSVGKLGEPYTNLPPIYQTKSFDEDAYKQAELKSKYGTLASQRDVRKFDRYMKSDAGVKALESARTTHNAAEHQKWSSSYSDYAAAIAAQSKARMLAAKQGFDNAVKKFDAPVEETPSTPALVLKDAARWNQVASQYGFKDYNAVAAWQKENGLEADGKFGAASYAKWSELNPDKVGTTPVIKPRVVTPQKPVTPTEDPTIDQTTPLIPGGYVELSNSEGNTFLQKTNSPFTNTSETARPFDLMGYAKQNGLNKFYNHGGKRYVRHDPWGAGDYLIGEDGKIYKAGLWGDLGDEANTSNIGIEGSDAYNNYHKVLGKLNEFKGVQSNKHGGTMNRINYFQQGGAAPQQQDIKAQVTALVQAAMQGDKKATETVNKIMEAAKAGDQQAIQIAQLMEQVIKQMKSQATHAKWGTKLSYLQALKCGGPAKKKMKKGAKVCPECEKKKIIKKNYFGGSVDKFGGGGEAKQSNKKNLRFFDRRSADMGNNRRVITETVYDYDDGYGNWLGDFAKVLGTRTIYETPQQNDTVYSYTHDPKIHLGTDTGYMGVANQEADQNGAKTNFLQQVRTTALPENQNTEEAKARRRAWIEGK